MNAAVDIGNTRIKVGFFEGGELVETITDQTLSALPDILGQKKLSKVILSSVAQVGQELLAGIPSIYGPIIFGPMLQLPIELRYGSPDTLGADRLAAVLGAAKALPNKRLLVIDMGSCITYDYLNTENAYLGGGITPGFAMRLKAMNAFTARLPEVATKAPRGFLGNDTESCMINGTYHGIVGELMYNISTYAAIENSEMGVFLTGGDAPHFISQLTTFDFQHDPDLVVKGLNIALLYQHEKHT